MYFNQFLLYFRYDTIMFHCKHFENTKQKTKTPPPPFQKKRKQNPRMRTPKKFEKYLANSNLLKINVNVLILQPNYDGTCVQLRKVQSYISMYIYLLI